MATFTSSTALSRRAMLAGSVAAPAVAFPALQAVAALPARTSSLPNSNPDAELFRRIAVAEYLRNRTAQARRLRTRLRNAREIKYDAVCRRFHDTHPEAWLHCWETHELYVDAVRDVMGTPAHTVAGLYAKLGLAVIASRRGGARVYMYEDREWLELTLIDLERLASLEQRDGTVRHQTPHAQAQV